MTDEQIVKALECCSIGEAICFMCPLYNKTDHCVDVLTEYAHDIIYRQKAEIEKLKAIISSFDELYGKGLDIANWHLNVALEPFDSFYESALQEMKEVSDENL